MKTKNTNNISWALFGWKPRYFWRNIKDLKYFFERIGFTLKHGYAPQAQWETFAWFIDVMKEILVFYRDDKYGTPIIIDNYEFGSEKSDEENEKAYRDLINRMIALLDLMDENNPIYDYGFDVTMKQTEEYDRMMEEAKNEFFELFSKYFYHFWD